VLSIDGCRPDALAAAKANNLIKFGRDGARASKAFTIPLSLTLPSHSSMLSGYDMERHGVDWNVPEPERGYIKVPTIFSVAHAAGLRTIMIMGKGKFLTLQLPDSLDEVHEVGGDEEGITDQAVFVIKKHNFDLLFIHFPNPDLVGHASGWMSAEYLARVARIDALFGKITAALPADATLIVTADHGGHDLGHGADLDVDRQIPWMIKGPGIRRGFTLNRRIETMDTAATALRVLGLSLDPVAQGRPVMEVFTK
jgi:predicted AlkP superfamily pyrophosphatase or phosphodiesterase